MKKGLIIETRVISEIRRQRELMGLKPVVLNEAVERIPFLNRVVKWLVGNAPETKLSDMLGGNAPQIMKRLQKLGINSIETLEKNLFDEAGTATRKIPTDVEKSIIKAFRKKVFTDPELADLAKESVVDYFDRLGNLPNGVSVSETVENLLSADFSIPEVKKAADDMIAELELRFGKDNEAIQYVKNNVEMKKVDNAFDDIDVNGPKVDEPTPDAPNPEDIKFDFGDMDSSKVSDVEVQEIIDDIDYGALARSIDFEPEVIEPTLSKSIRKVADKSRLFRSLSDSKKEEVIQEAQSQFINAYNRQLTDATKQIDGLKEDPEIIAKLEKAWNSIGTNPSAQATIIENALKKTKNVEFRWNTKAFWANYFTGKVPTTGEYPGPKQFLTNYLKAVAVSAIIESGIMIKKAFIDGENIGWDNIPGDNAFEKINNLMTPGKAVIKTVFPVLGHIFVGLDLTSDILINEYRKPSTDEIRKRLGVKPTAAVRVEEIVAQNTKYAEYSRTVFINDVNIGDWALRIKDKELVKMKSGQPIPPDAVDANANAGGNTPAPAPTPTTKTTMTKAEVEAEAIKPKHGYVAPITFTPNEDNKAEYAGSDKDGYKFKATLNNGVITITPL